MRVAYKAFFRMIWLLCFIAYTLCQFWQVSLGCNVDSMKGYMRLPVYLLSISARCEYYVDYRHDMDGFCCVSWKTEFVRG